MRVCNIVEGVVGISSERSAVVSLPALAQVNLETPKERDP